MTQQGSESTWAPQPAGYDSKQYYAGYSDGWYGERYGLSQEDPSASYGAGFEKARADKGYSA